MDFFSLSMLSSLFSIIIIDLALAGDNAVVIAMAARRLPQEHQRKAIYWGTVGAVIVRTALTLATVYLLNLPMLMLVGGLLLIPIAINLLRENNAVSQAHIKQATTLAAAIRTIIIADVLMGIDNVLGVAGAANGHIGLVIIGLLISIPMIVWGSTIILKYLDRWPFLIYIGAGTIAWTAARMISHDHLLSAWFDQAPILRLVLDIALVALVCGTGYVLSRRKKPDVEHAAASKP